MYRVYVSSYLYRHIYLKSVFPAVSCRTTSVLPLKMHMKHYVDINDMVLNIISVPISLIIFERFYNVCKVFKSSTLILKDIYIFRPLTSKRNKGHLLRPSGVGRE